jgi:hypothetical protein
MEHFIVRNLCCITGNRKDSRGCGIAGGGSPAIGRHVTLVNPLIAGTDISQVQLASLALADNVLKMYTGNDQAACLISSGFLKR